jgi:hypothetical protein
MLQFIEEALNQMPLLVLPPVNFPWFAGVTLWRNGVCSTLGNDIVTDFLRAICFVTVNDASYNIYLRQKFYGNGAVVGVTAGKHQPKRVAKSVNQRMDFSSISGA